MGPRIAFALTTLLLLAGCAAGTDKTELESWRGRMAAAAELSFTADITAQGPDAVWEFTGDVRRTGEEIRLTLTAPESIRGISVRSAPGSAELEYETVRLLLPTGREERLAPCAAGSILLRALEEGHVLRTGRSGEYRSAALTGPGDETVTLWRDAQGVPVYAEIAWEEETVMTLRLTNWTVKE